MQFGDINITLTKKGWLALGLGLFAGFIFLMLAWSIGLLAILVSFVLALVNFIWGFILWLLAQLGLISLVTGIIGWVTAQITAIFAWFATTWLGSLLMPIYTWIMPILAKFGPFLTMGKWGKRLWAWANSFHKKGEQELPVEIHHKN